MSHSRSHFDNVNLYLLLDGAVVGALSLRMGGNGDFEFGCKNWINSISIAEDHQGKGYSRVIIEYFFKYCSENGIQDILQSSYTVDGKQKVMRVFEELSEKYPEVGFFDKKRDF